MLQTALHDNQRPIHLIFWIYFIPILATAAAGCSMCTRINWSTKATHNLPVSEWIQKAPGWINSWPYVVQISKSFKRYTELQILNLRYDLIALLWPIGCDTARSCYSARDETKHIFRVWQPFSLEQHYKPQNIITILRPQLPLATCWKATKAVWTCIPSFLGNFSLSPWLFQGVLEVCSHRKCFWAHELWPVLSASPESSPCLETLLIPCGMLMTFIPNSYCILPHAFKFSTASMWHKGWYKANKHFMK